VADRRPGEGAGSAGFTLVEVLVALVLVALVIQLMFGGLRFGSRVWERTLGEAEAIDRVVSVQRFLRDRLGGVSRPNPFAGAQNATSQVNFWFSGRRDGMEFVAAWRHDAAYSGFYRFTLSPARTAGKTALQLTWRPEAEEKIPAAMREALLGERNLLDDIAGFDLSYFGAAEPRSDPDWHDEWDDTKRMPTLVRIELVLPGSDMDWPPLVVATGW